jgi:hypothetical protein
MKRERIVILNNHMFVGEEIEAEEFPDLETFRRQAARWEGPENLLILRNVRLEDSPLEERLDYLLVKRDAVSALGLGKLTVQGFIKEEG